MGLDGYLKRQDAAVSRRVTGQMAYFSLSPSRVALCYALEPLIAEYAHGRCLDAGAGWQAHRPLLEPHVSEYVSLDYDPARGRNDVCGSVLELPFSLKTFDTVYCSQVLEHVQDDRRLWQEFFRVLKPGGVVILSVPHLAYLHNEPHDYRRLTRHGLRKLAEQAGFEVVASVPAGGLLCFLSHPFSMIAKAFAEPLPGVRQIAGFINSIASRAVFGLDCMFDRKKRFALNEVIVARRPE